MKINPNPKPHTNSEMDSKTILKPSLTDSQIYDLVCQYVQIKVDRMSHSDLVEHVTQDLIDWYSDFSSDELKDTISVNDEDLYNELLDNVTHTFTSEDN